MHFFSISRVFHFSNDSFHPSPNVRPLKELATINVKPAVTDADDSVNRSGGEKDSSLTLANNISPSAASITLRITYRVIKFLLCWVSQSQPASLGLWP